MDRISRPLICNASLQVTKGSLAKTRKDFSCYAKTNVVTIQNQNTWTIHAYISVSYQMSSLHHISKRSDYRFKFHVT